MCMEITKYWRLNLARYRLVGQRDPKSDSIEFPPKADPNKKQTATYFSSKSPLYTSSSCREEQEKQQQVQEQ